MSKPPSRPRGIRMIVDEVIPFDHPKLLGLKRPRTLREQDHRRWIAYGVQCAKEFLPHYVPPRVEPRHPVGAGSYDDPYGTRHDLRDMDYMRILGDLTVRMDYSKPLPPLSIPGGHSDREPLERYRHGFIDTFGESSDFSKAVLAGLEIPLRNNVMADPIFIQRQQEENPYHPAKIKQYGTDADVFMESVERYTRQRYASTVPQIHLSDLADFDHPFEEKVLELSNMYRVLHPRDAGKSRSINQLPFLTTQLLAHWLQNNGKGWERKTQPLGVK